MQYECDDKLILLSKINALRIMEEDGIERALRLFPELSEFIHNFSNWNYEEAEKEAHLKYT
jgi:hypothetical protein